MVSFNYFFPLFPNVYLSCHSQELSFYKFNYEENVEGNY